MTTTSSPESLANWIAREPVAVLPPYMRMGKGFSVRVVGRGRARDW